MRTTLKLSEIVDQWIADSDITAPSRADYRRKIELWFRYLSGIGVDPREPRRHHLLEYKKHLQAQGKSQFTVNSYVTIAKLFYRYCAQQKYCENIGAGVKSSTRFKEHTRQPLTRAEAARLLDSIPTDTLIGKRDKLMVALMLTNGLRTCEVERIDSGDFLTANGRSVLMIQRKGRADKREMIAVTPLVESLKDEYLTARSNDTPALFVSHCPGQTCHRLTRIAVSQMVKARLRAIGIDRPEVTAHSLRHTCGSLLVESGVGIEQIRDLLGHTDTATTRIYIEMAVRRKTLENSPANIIEAMLLGKEK